MPFHAIRKHLRGIIMDIRKIRQVIDLIQKKGVNEIEICEAGESVKIKINSTDFIPYQTSIPPQHPHHITAPQQFTNPNHSAPTTSTPSAAASAHTASQTITSPMVGTFYRSPSPDSKPFVEVGQSVKAGDVLCIVEAMKMFNQIESDRAGIVAAILAENSQPVEYGQPLFKIE